MEQHNLQVLTDVAINLIKPCFADIKEILLRIPIYSK